MTFFIILREIGHNMHKKEFFTRAMKNVEKRPFSVASSLPNGVGIKQ